MKRVRDSKTYKIVEEGVQRDCRWRVAIAGILYTLLTPILTISLLALVF